MCRRPGNEASTLVRRVVRTPAPLELDERVRHLLGQRQALEDVVLQQLPEGILVPAHVRRLGRRLGDARLTRSLDIGRLKRLSEVFPRPGGSAARLVLRLPSVVTRTIGM